MTLGLLKAAERAGLQLDAQLVASDPGTASARFGIAAVPLVGFEQVADEAARAELLASGALPAETTRALEVADALIVAGGGNISRSWPALVYERLALARAARQRGIPVLITGQSLGPWFGAEVGSAARELLSIAELVGVRERCSHWLAGQLGVPAQRLVLTSDDALGLIPQPPAEVPAAPFVAVTINDLGADRLSELGSQLARLRQHLGCRFVLVPHVGNLDGPSVDDVAVAHRLAELVPAEIAELPTPQQAVWYCRHAELVISSRYHPVVFAIEQRRPVLFLAQDAYTAMKGGGALEQAGLSGWQLPVDELGDLAVAGAELWNRRHDIAAHLDGQRPDHLPAMLARLAGSSEPVPTVLPELPGPQPTGAWARPPQSLVDLWDVDASRWFVERDRLSASVRELTERADTAERYAESLLGRSETAEEFAAALVKRCEDAEEYAASLLTRAETAERYAASLEETLARRNHGATAEVTE